MLFFHEVCHSSKIYLLIDGLTLENGILKEDALMKATFLLADLPSHSLECLYAKRCDIFQKVSESVDSLNWNGS